MKKQRKMIALTGNGILRNILLCLCVALGILGFTLPVPADTPAYTEKTYNIYRQSGLTEETIRMRYFADRPHVPYVSISDYYRLVYTNPKDPEQKGTLTAARQADGSILFTNVNGSAVLNAEKDTMSSDNLEAFICMMPFEADNDPDQPPFIRKKEHRLEGSAAASFSFSDYGIDLIADGDDIWFPHTTLSNIYSDLNFRHTEFNGKYLYFIESNTNPKYFGAMLDSSYAQALTENMYENGKTRPQDLVTQTYADLCFSLRNFYGAPAHGKIGKNLREKGLEATLDALGEPGKKIKELLLSTDSMLFALGVGRLHLYMADGHSNLQSVENLLPLSDEASAQMGKLRDELSPLYAEAETYTKARDITTYAQSERSELRYNAYGNTLYKKSGDMAVGILDSFGALNLEAWRAFYAGKAKRPERDSLQEPDSLSDFLYSLDKAAADPEVKTFILDITNNRGGFVDVLVTIYGLITGKREVSVTSENVLTGQKITDVYEVDRNFDGAFDEKDNQPVYNFNFVVETTSTSFSCGNLLPSMLKDAGYRVIGEQSGGGSCALLIQGMDDGYPYMLSAWQSRLTNAAGEDIDGGVEVDASLLLKNADGSIKQTTNPETGQPSGAYDYSMFYNLDELRLAVEGRQNEPRFRTNSLLLSGTIGVNFYMYLPEREDVDYSKSYVDFTVCGKTRRAAFDKDKMNKDRTLYGFTCSVNVAQMADEITAVYHYFTKDGEEKTASASYSVFKYLSDAFSRIDASETQLRALTEALQDYGFHAQVYLSKLRGWTPGKDHASVDACYKDDYSDDLIAEAKNDLAQKAISVRKSSDIAKVTFSLNLDADTAVYLYFKPAAGYSGSVSATVNGKDAEVEKLSDGRYRVAVRDIAAHRLGDMANVTLTTAAGSTNVTVSAMSYVKACLDAPADTDETRAMMALYGYYKEAAAYIC